METVNQEITEQKTFTQAEVDKIVSERLCRDRAKYADYEDLKAKAGKYDEMEEASKSELQKATERASDLQRQLDDMKAAENIRIIRERVSQETGVPAALLTAGTEDDCKAQADAIKAYATPMYPSVKDAGEVVGAPRQKTTAQEFAAWVEQIL